MGSEDSDRSVSGLVEQWHKERPDLDLTAFRLVSAIMQLAQILEAEFRALAHAKFNIGSGDLRILMALRRAGEPYALRPTDLFQSLLVSSGAVTKQVERLVATGYVHRVLARTGKRRQLIALTPKGLRAADYAQDAIATSLAGVAPTFGSMDPGQVDTTLHCLEQILEVATLAQALRPIESREDEN
ncbi:MarR family winged helix-turn-helix transcriptional regulator [Variovorax sp. LT1R16]|uniref:MarR family winged helix-turn-helix transcriptional regulator n=1 Tax=Variovorax sp. LT1R16 TaxID=3443728 RepID=UPI003F48D38D